MFEAFWSTVRPGELALSPALPRVSEFITGVVAGDGSAGVVTVVDINTHDGNAATLTYRSSGGQLDGRIITAGDLSGFAIAPQRLWSFDADGYFFRLASEARRMPTSTTSTTTTLPWKNWRTSPSTRPQPRRQSKRLKSGSPDSVS